MTNTIHKPIPPPDTTMGVQDNPPPQSLSTPSIVVSRPSTPSSSPPTRGRPRRRDQIRAFFSIHDTRRRDTSLGSQTSAHTRAPSPDAPGIEHSTALTSSKAAHEVAPPSDDSRTPSVPGSSFQEKMKEPSADNAMSNMWDAAMAQCQERMGVDFLGPEAAKFRSEKDVMDYIQHQVDSASDNEDKKGWQKLRRGLIPLARVAKIFCDSFADTISDVSAQYRGQSLYNTHCDR